MFYQLYSVSPPLEHLARFPTAPPTAAHRLVLMPIVLTSLKAKFVS